jgi:hypothetical protein
MTQPPYQPPPAWGGQPGSGTPVGQPSWQQPGPARSWTQPAVPQVPPQPGAPAWEQRPGPPAGPPPGQGVYGSPPPPQQSRRGMWWAIGGALVAILVAAGVLVFVLLQGVDPPTGVSATASPEGVSVTWQPVDGATGYEVFRDGESVGTTDTTTFVDTEVPGGTEVQYSVVATEGDDRSEATAADAAVLTPVEAPAPTATADGGQVQLTWEQVTGAERYEVTRNGESLDTAVTEGSYVDDTAPLGDHSYDVTAVDEDGSGSTATGTVQVFSPGPWGDAYEISVAFPDLVGAGPDDTGWNGSTCATDIVEGTKALIFCDYSNGVYIEVSQFADAGQRDARIAEIEAAAGVESGTWSYGDGAAEGDLYVSGADSDTAWRFITFYSSDRELFSIYAEWPEHTQDELRTTWFADAPF